MSEILTREEFRDFMHRAFSNIKFELDEQGRLIGAHDQPFNRLLAHDAALRARVAELERVIDAAPHGQGCEGWREFPVSACNCWKASVR